VTTSRGLSLVDANDLTGSSSDLQRFLRILWDSDDVRELRIPRHNQYGHTASGYFDSPDGLAAAAARWDGRGNLYVSLNPVSPALLARACNRVLSRAEATTADADILARRWLLVDVDPVRPGGISSTDSELEAAHILLDSVTGFLSDDGWPEPVTAMSGNGCYALYAIDLPNDQASSELTKRVLGGLAARFDNDRARVDSAVANASRLVGLVGTRKMKGDSTEERPHRRSCLLNVPDRFLPVLPDLPESLANFAPKPEKTRIGTGVAGPQMRLDELLERSGIEYREQPPDAAGVTWYHVRQCPFHADGRPFECGVGQRQPDGVLCGKCFHPEGEGMGWQEWKQALGIDVGHRGKPRLPSTNCAPSQDEGLFPRADAGNGELFACCHGERVRYDHRRKRWLIWSGHWWRPDADAEVRRLAKATARKRYDAAAELFEELEERKRESSFAIGSENRQRLDAMLAQAQTEAPISDAGDNWDADRWLVGVANGVVDLHTGELREGHRGDRITLHSDALFDRDAPCTRWERFLEEVFGADCELISFIARAVGYSLTGDTSEQCLFMCHGSGANGKSVFLTTLRSVAGTYAYNSPFSTLELAERSSIPNDLAALVGKRLVTASETNEAVRLNEARLKALTGGDPVTARFLHGEFFTFQPVCKLWLAANHRPRVGDDSYGFWRRVRLIPFTRRFTDDADRHLAETLRTELPGILNWAVNGALAWQREGLEPPAAVQSATESYRVESDPLAEFIEERCAVGSCFVASAGQLYEAYRQWAADQGMREREVLSTVAFGRRMSERFEKRHTRSGKSYHGVGLLSDRSAREQQT
jgi:putative DNA primase/helicase